MTIDAEKCYYETPLDSPLTHHPSYRSYACGPFLRYSTGDPGRM
ncbi:hypothetical protein RSSM_03402 [Rhodopirellula sallentina SM41]|uniref:Uncharacterized protein n=1 Tax=Rhodopirellula sallentina SM41 TaxID=1263870 RepID=M5UGE0_9BACT|nr:hypothetical protein RSSM_03402 [Rhodopirellula sallentina SM41]